MMSNVDFVEYMRKTTKDNRKWVYQQVKYKGNYKENMKQLLEPTTIQLVRLTLAELSRFKIKECDKKILLNECKSSVKQINDSVKTTNSVKINNKLQSTRKRLSDTHATDTSQPKHKKKCTSINAIKTHNPTVKSKDINKLKNNPTQTKTEYARNKGKKDVPFIASKHKQLPKTPTNTNQKAVKTTNVNSSPSVCSTKDIKPLSDSKKCHSTKRTKSITIPEVVANKKSKNDSKPNIEIGVKSSCSSHSGLVPETKCSEISELLDSLTNLIEKDNEEPNRNQTASNTKLTMQAKKSENNETCRPINNSKSDQTISNNANKNVLLNSAEPTQNASTNSEANIPDNNDPSSLLNQSENKETSKSDPVSNPKTCEDIKIKIEIPENDSVIAKDAMKVQSTLNKTEIEKESKSEQTISNNANKNVLLNSAEPNQNAPTNSEENIPDNNDTSSLLNQSENSKSDPVSNSKTCEDIRIKIEIPENVSVIAKEEIKVQSTLNKTEIEKKSKSEPTTTCDKIDSSVKAKENSHTIPLIGDSILIKTENEDNSKVCAKAETQNPNSDDIPNKILVNRRNSTKIDEKFDKIFATLSTNIKNTEDSPTSIDATLPSSKKELIHSEKNDLNSNTIVREEFLDYFPEESNFSFCVADDIRNIIIKREIIDDEDSIETVICEKGMVVNDKETAIISIFPHKSDSSQKSSEEHITDGTEIKKEPLEFPTCFSDSELSNSTKSVIKLKNEETSNNNNESDTETVCLDNHNESDTETVCLDENYMDPDILDNQETEITSDAVMVDFEENHKELETGTAEIATLSNDTHKSNIVIVVNQQNTNSEDRTEIKSSFEPILSVVHLQKEDSSKIDTSDKKLNVEDSQHCLKVDNKLSEKNNQISSKEPIKEILQKQTSHDSNSASTKKSNNPNIQSIILNNIKNHNSSSYQNHEIRSTREKYVSEQSKFFTHKIPRSENKNEILSVPSNILVPFSEILKRMHVSSTTQKPAEPLEIDLNSSDSSDSKFSTITSYAVPDIITNEIETVATNKVVMPLKPILKKRNSDENMIRQTKPQNKVVSENKIDDMQKRYSDTKENTRRNMEQDLMSSYSVPKNKENVSSLPVDEVAKRRSSTCLDKNSSTFQNSSQIPSDVSKLTDISEKTKKKSTNLLVEQKINRRSSLDTRKTPSSISKPMSKENLSDSTMDDNRKRRSIFKHKERRFSSKEEASKPPKMKIDNCRSSRLSIDENTSSSNKSNKLLKEEIIPYKLKRITSLDETQKIKNNNSKYLSLADYNRRNSTSSDERRMRFLVEQNVNKPHQSTNEDKNSALEKCESSTKKPEDSKRLEKAQPIKLPSTHHSHPNTTKLLDKNKRSMPSLEDLFGEPDVVSKKGELRLVTKSPNKKKITTKQTKTKSNLIVPVKIKLDRIVVDQILSSPPTEELAKNVEENQISKPCVAVSCCEKETVKQVLPELVPKYETVRNNSVHKVCSSGFKTTQRILPKLAPKPKQLNLKAVAKNPVIKVCSSGVGITTELPQKLVPELQPHRHITKTTNSVVESQNTKILPRLIPDSSEIITIPDSDTFEYLPVVLPSSKAADHIMLPFMILIEEVHQMMKAEPFAMDKLCCISENLYKCIASVTVNVFDKDEFVAQLSKNIRSLDSKLAKYSTENLTKLFMNVLRLVVSCHRLGNREHHNLFNHIFNMVPIDNVLLTPAQNKSDNTVIERTSLTSFQVNFEQSAIVRKSNEKQMPGLIQFTPDLTKTIDTSNTDIPEVEPLNFSINQTKSYLQPVATNLRESTDSTKSKCTLQTDPVTISTNLRESTESLKSKSDLMDPVTITNLKESTKASKSKISTPVEDISLTSILKLKNMAALLETRNRTVEPVPDETPTRSNRIRIIEDRVVNPGNINNQTSFLNNMANIVDRVIPKKNTYGLQNLQPRTTQIPGTQCTGINLDQLKHQQFMALNYQNQFGYYPNQLNYSNPTYGYYNTNMQNHPQNPLQTKTEMMKFLNTEMNRISFTGNPYYPNNLHQYLPTEPYSSYGSSNNFWSPVLHDNPQQVRDRPIHAQDNTIDQLVTSQPDLLYKNNNNNTLNQNIYQNNQNVYIHITPERRQSQTQENVGTQSELLKKYLTAPVLNSESISENSHRNAPVSNTSGVPNSYTQSSSVSNVKRTRNRTSNAALQNNSSVVKPPVHAPTMTNNQSRLRSRNYRSIDEILSNTEQKAQSSPTFEQLNTIHSNASSTTTYPQQCRRQMSSDQPGLSISSTIQENNRNDNPIHVYPNTQSSPIVSSPSSNTSVLNNQIQVIRENIRINQQTRTNAQQPLPNYQSSPAEDATILRRQLQLADATKHSILPNVLVNTKSQISVDNVQHSLVDFTKTTEQSHLNPIVSTDQQSNVVQHLDREGGELPPPSDTVPETLDDNQQDEYIDFEMLPMLKSNKHHQKPHELNATKVPRIASRDSGYTSPNVNHAQTLEDMILCAHCSSPGSYLCSGCRKSYYCSRGCQQMAWEMHRDHCT